MTKHKQMTTPTAETQSKNGDHAIAPPPTGPAGALRIPGDVVARATADLPKEERSAIRWLYQHGAERGMTMKELAAKIKRSHNTLYQVFTGRHGAEKASIAKAIIHYQCLAIARSDATKLGFISTTLTKKIWQLCEAALTYQRVAFLWGDPQTGKTTALEEYARQHNHGETIYVSMPVGGYMSHFLAELCTVLKIPLQLREKELRRRIISAFDDQMLLIVDEGHQCFMHSARAEPARHVRSLEFIRELHDRTKCGVVISATNTMRDEMDHGRASGILLQLRRRRLAALQLPNTPTDEDLNTFAASYGLPPAEGAAKKLQDDMIAQEALGMWLTLLRMAANRTSRNKIPLTWEEVQKSRHIHSKLESMKG